MAENTYYVDTESTAPTSEGTYTAPFKTQGELSTVMSNKVAADRNTYYISGRSVFSCFQLSVDMTIIQGGDAFYGDWVPGTVSDRYTDREQGHRAKMINAKPLTTAAGYTWLDQGGGVYKTTILLPDSDVSTNWTTFYSKYGADGSLAVDYLGNPLSFTGLYVKSGESYVPLMIQYTTTNPEADRWSTDSTDIYVNLGGDDPNSKELYISCVGTNFSSLLTLENWSPGSYFEGFEVWFGFSNGNTGCVGGVYKNIDFYYSATSAFANIGGYSDLEDIYI